MFLNSQIFSVCLLLIIEFKTHLGQETASLQSNGTVYARTIDTKTPENSLTSLEVKDYNNLHNVEPNTYNKSIEYLIEDPNTTIRRHEQQVIIKPLNYLKNQPTSLPPLAETTQELLLKPKNQENQSVQELNVQPTVAVTNVTEREMVKLITPGNEKKDVLIINLLSSQNQLPVCESIQSLNDSQKGEVTEVLRHPDQISVSSENNEEAATSLHDQDQQQQLLFNAINTDNQPSEIQLNKPMLATDDTNKDMIFKPINLFKQYPLTTEEETTTLNYDREHPNTFIGYKKDNLMQKPLAQESITITNETNVVQTSNSHTSVSESSEENKDLTPKPLVSLEDYAVKQMDFILDHMLLESQEFVAKVLQATGNTLFHRDPLKRYAENLNNLLNPQLESDYSDEIYVPSHTVQQDLYEDVIKKINFLKSKTTKELQRHLPANWIKEYQDKKEELKVWLNKASDEMHRVFNFYVDDEDDHIRYLYFNEAFDDIARATEIHQKLALLADLIKIVKNKKQITFMDLYMQ